MIYSIRKDKKVDGGACYSIFRDNRYITSCDTKEEAESCLESIKWCDMAGRPVKAEGEK